MDVYLFVWLDFSFLELSTREWDKQEECFLLFRGYVIQYRFLIGMLSWPCLHDIHQFFIYAHHSLSLINVPVSYIHNIDLSVPSYKQTNKQTTMPRILSSRNELNSKRLYRYYSSGGKGLSKSFTLYDSTNSGSCSRKTSTSSSPNMISSQSRQELQMVNNSNNNSSKGFLPNVSSMSSFPRIDSYESSEWGLFVEFSSDNNDTATAATNNSSRGRWLTGNDGPIAIERTSTVCSISCLHLETLQHSDHSYVASNIRGR